MATFVLVHGAWHGSWCWKRVRHNLQQLGHEVFTPTLTGVGERSHLLSKAVGLQTQTLDVLNLIKWEELSDFVLCGHSYGGMVICGVADRITRRARLGPPGPASGRYQGFPNGFARSCFSMRSCRRTASAWRIWRRHPAAMS